jgi:poly(A) polymerase Pap1
MGVALEIMLVLVCQLFPNHSEFDILHHFFQWFAQWPWGDSIVMIKGTVASSASLVHSNSCL